MANEAKSDKALEITSLGMSVSISRNNRNWFAEYMALDAKVQENLFKMLLNEQITNPAKKEAIQQMAITKGWMKVITAETAEKAEEKVEVPF